MAIQRLSHIGICVSDLARALAFYRDGLGFCESSELEVAGEPAQTLLGLPETRLHAVYLERDGTRIELLHFEAPGHVGDATPRPMNQLGLTHLSLRVDDLDEALARLGELSGRVLEETRIGSPAFGAGAAFVTDPDGTRIELVQQPGDPSKPPAAQPPSD